MLRGSIQSGCLMSSSKHRSRIKVQATQRYLQRSLIRLAHKANSSDDDQQTWQLFKQSVIQSYSTTPISSRTVSNSADSFGTSPLRYVIDSYRSLLAAALALEEWKEVCKASDPLATKDEISIRGNILLYHHYQYNYLKGRRVTFIIS